MKNNRKGVSPVIATVIIVAVAIAIAIAVAFWMTGLIGTFTKYEKLTIVRTNSTYDSPREVFNVTVIVKNTGSSSLAIYDVLVNDKSVSEEKANYYYINGENASLPYFLNPGELAKIDFDLNKNTKYNHGMSIEIKIVTVGGTTYTRTLVLP